MKSKILLPLALSIASASAVANEFGGSRFGVGYAWTGVDYDTSSTWYDGDTGNGLALTYGYDFNRVVGMNLNYYQNEGSVDKSEFSGSTFSMDLDIGWAFNLGHWSLKPYGAIGFGSHNQDIKEFTGTSCSLGVCNDHFKESSVDGSGLSIGLGIRAQMNNGIFFELRDDALFVDSYSLAGRTSLIAGYKF
ncbi:porin family protein [Vibrio sp. 10N.247.311.51]|uniref:porin family protein n=1 Tax=Vibrio sp. 10N.247.311.51 TaxID=3229996 RepID=UPI0035524916